MIDRTRTNDTFEELPFVKRVRELRNITGGSTTCGWMTDEGVFFLYMMVKWYKPELVIQAGHLWGKSALVVAEALNDGFLTGSVRIEDREQNADRQCEEFMASNRPAPTMGEVISIDPKPINVPDYQAGVEYIQGLHSNFSFYKMTSGEFFNNIDQLLDSSPKGKRIMGIVDGDHSWLGCASDLDALKNLGADMIFVDDTSWLPHIRRVCQMFARREGYEFFDFRAHNGFGVLLRQSTPPAHLIDGDYAGIPRMGESVYKIGGYKFTRAIFDIAKFIGACSPKANRWTIRNVPRHIIKNSLRKTIHLLFGEGGWRMLRRVYRSTIGNNVDYGSEDQK